MIRSFFSREGSTRTAALLRIGLVLLLWTRWGSDFLLYRLDDRFEWVIGLSFYLGTAFLLVGLYTRIASVWTALTMLTVFYYLGVHEGVEPYTHHHTYLLVSLAVLVALLPSDRSLSVDRYLALRTGSALPESAPIWSLKLVALQISSLYFWTAYDKCSRAFLSGERLQAIFLERYGSSDPPAIPYFEVLCQIAAMGTLVTEFGLAFLLWVPRLQLPGLLLAMVFHGFLYVMLPVGPFSCTMVLMILAFFDPDLVHGALDRLLSLPATPLPDGKSSAP